ncbi:MAG: hypothetical protein SW833_08435 [Cyanobacteriota bacterium]|nr:hypothetical protein [Cyanobacteriota bacterium]
MSLAYYIQNQKTEEVFAELLLNYLNTNPFDRETKERIVELARLNIDKNFSLRIPLALW